MRIVAATNKQPLKAVESGELRNDLYYRLNGFSINLPPLRDRLGDIPILTEALIRQLNKKHDKNLKGTTDRVLKMFSTHNWPGNVRELRNVVERSLIVCDKDLIEDKHLPVLEQREVVPSSNSLAIPVGTTVAEAESSSFTRHSNSRKTTRREPPKYWESVSRRFTTNSTFMTLRLKTRLTLTITTLVLVVLSIVSLFTIITFTREQIRSRYEGGT